jgi:pimeloyl-ACP methyl ester carboxylesterase
VISYLHGFASSPQSTKAQYFGGKCAGQGVTFSCLDFNLPDFRSMTISRMLEQLTADIERSFDFAQGGLPAEPVTLVGSSLGGALAVLAAERLGDRVDRLVLMAPAVMFARPGHHLLPPDRVEEWRRRGALPFFHYAYGEERLLDFAFHEDSLRYDAFGASFAQPTLVFQGLRDRSVDPRTVEQFAQARSNVALSLLDDDHQLTASLPQMWNAIEPFLGLTT